MVSQSSRYIVRRAHHKIRTGFMDGHQANVAFVACGPPGFTALALINLGKKAQEMYVKSREV